MALANIQERVERSLYEALRKVCVAEGYTPDITNTGLYGTSPYTAVNEAAWEAALKTIETTKGFAIEVFNNSQTKGTKLVPRIAIIPRRTLAGDIGSPQHSWITNNPSGEQGLVRRYLPLEASAYYYDIHLITKTAQQDRILHGILRKALGVKRFIEWYDDPGELLFVVQTSDFDLPDPTEGIKEQVYTYLLPDLFEFVEEGDAVAITTEITIEDVAIEAGETIQPNPDENNGETAGKTKVEKDKITYQA